MLSCDWHFISEDVTRCKAAQVIITFLDLIPSAGFSTTADTNAATEK